MSAHYGRPVKSIYDAHKPRMSEIAAIGPTDAPSRGEVPGRAGDVSVTALHFLPQGQEHLLLSASEADASVKLWDIRALHTKRKIQTPLSYTLQPQSHTKWRHFGLSSLNLSTDGSRIYTLCKDNTIYAFSTSHLINGHAPELSRTQERYQQRSTQEGLGPLYGFRHQKMLASSFYIKSAIRKAKDGRCEILAAGSNEGCAVLFPTDERYFPENHMQQPNPTFSSSLFAQRPTLLRAGTGVGGRVGDSIPILTHGTPLIRAHDDQREVGALTWTHDGDLITLGDDFQVRLWREGGNHARNLRLSGEFGGERWKAGWADVGEDYDEDDD